MAEAWLTPQQNAIMLHLHLRSLLHISLYANDLIHCQFDSVRAVRDLDRVPVWLVVGASTADLGLAGFGGGRKTMTMGSAVQ